METPKTILIVDDEPDILDYIEALFQDGGYRTIVALDGAEALKKAKIEKPDLITLDITMPKESGVRMYRDLVEQEETKDIPVIIVTGVSKEFKQFIYGRKNLKPPAAYFEKPIDQEKLVVKITELIS